MWKSSFSSFPPGKESIKCRALTRKAPDGYKTIIKITHNPLGAGDIVKTERGPSAPTEKFTSPPVQFLRWKKSRPLFDLIPTSLVQLETCIIPTDAALTRPFPHITVFADSRGFVEGCGVEAWETDGLLGASNVDWKEKTVGLSDSLVLGREERGREKGLRTEDLYRPWISSAYGSGLQGRVA